MHLYIDVLAEVVLVLGLGVESVARLSADLVLGPLRIQEFIMDVVVGSLGSLLSWVKGGVP